MKKEEIIKIIELGENESVEFKENFNEEVIETLVAFSNAIGGKIILGVNDKKGIMGVNLGKESLINWINEIKNKTTPFLIPDIFEFEIDNKKIVVLEIQEFPLKPVSFRGRYFIRKANSNHSLSLSEVSEIYLKTKNSSWDFFRDANSDISNLDKTKVRKLKKLIEKSLDKDMGTEDKFLRKYSLVVKDGKREFPTYASMLLFSKEPLRSTDIQIGIFQDNVTIKKDKLIREDLISEVDSVMDFIKLYILKEFVFTGASQREERWQYPLRALREFVINAIIHRDYRDGTHSQFKIFPDKIVLWNAGKLPVGLTIEEIKKGTEKSYPRNKLIAEIFRDSDLIERYGSGVARAIKEFKDYGLKEPEIREVAGGIEVVLYGFDSFKPQSNGALNGGLNEGLNEGLKSLFNLISSNPQIKAKECSAKLNRPIKTIERQMGILIERKLIERKGSRKTGGYFIVK